MKSLRAKLAYINLLLVFFIGAVGMVSVINFYHLGKSIDGLMIDNYKSISAARYMNMALRDQNAALLDFIYHGSENAVDISSAAKSRKLFEKWFNIEAHNITEKNESTIVLKLGNHYQQYQQQFSAIVTAGNGAGTKQGQMPLQLYRTNVLRLFRLMESELSEITNLNETAMFEKKDIVTRTDKRFMYIAIAVAALAALLGLLASRFFTNKFLKPLYILKENMKATKEGHMKQELPVLYDDEIGALTSEFNNMLARLQVFERSTKGKLLEEKNRSLAIVKSISDPLLVLDNEFRVLLLNNAFELFFGVKEANAADRLFSDVINLPDVSAHIKNAYTSEEEKYVPKIITVSMKDKNFYFDTIVTKVRDERGYVKGMVVLFQNITKLKRLEKTKTEFVASISHEFKTPLTSITMGTSLLKDSGLGTLNPRQQEIIETIEEDTDNLSKLVMDLIQLSKIESDRALFNFKPCALSRIVEHSVKKYADLARAKELRLVSQVEDSLPRIMADPEKIAWVINNLISNAIKYTNTRDSITISAVVLRDDMLAVSVADTGIGISEEYLEKIFERFVKLDTELLEASGSGLGLAIAKEIVEIHRGRIWCESTMDAGSCFTFTIPLATISQVAAT